MIVKYIAYRAIGMIALLSAIVLGLSLWVGAQDRPKASEGGGQARPQTEYAPALSASLIDPQPRARL